MRITEEELERRWGKRLEAWLTLGGFREKYNRGLAVIGEEKAKVGGGFDRVGYQREYMRKRRAKQKLLER